ncbi:hypothetical protein [Telmatospirillum siberiense]|uniref:hypothetical protein n=1 Tax=Telmatospirillum siberiense TaxID=382514 RepID=UPI0013045E51|nr:hypothetical protein [Telmatospirillum siberiense]
MPAPRSVLVRSLSILAFNLLPGLALRAPLPEVPDGRGRIDHGGKRRIGRSKNRAYGDPGHASTNPPHHDVPSNISRLQEE